MNGHGGNVATCKAAFPQIYKSASQLKLPAAKNLRLKISSWFMAPEVFNEAKNLYGDLEGQHATPSEIAITLYKEPSLIKKQIPLPKPAPSGPIYDSQDFRKRYPDGRMGSNPYLATPQHGKIFVEKAASALSQELLTFLQTS